MKKLFDQLNLRYDEQYNDSVPLNQTVIVLVSPLFLCMHAVTDYGSSRSKAQRKGVMIRAGKESGKKPSPLPLRFFLSCFPSASSYTGIIQNINRKGQSTSYTYSLLICNN